MIMLKRKIETSKQLVEYVQSPMLLRYSYTTFTHDPSNKDNHDVKKDPIFALNSSFSHTPS